MTIVFRCEFGPDYGLGHLMRIISLSQAFAQRGKCKQILLTNSDAAYFKSLLETASFTVINFNHHVEGLAFDLREFVDTPKDAITVFDHYDVTAGQMKAYQEAGNFLVAIDDLGDREITANVILNQNIGAELIYQKKNLNILYLLGLEYCLIRKQFNKTHRQLEEKDPTSILLTLGGGDITERLSILLSAIKRVDQLLVNKIKLDVVLPKLPPNDLEKINHITKAYQLISVNMIFDCYDLSDTMKKSKLAISSCGSTVYELASVGVPVLGIAIADNQMPAAIKLEEFGIGRYVSRINDFDEARFVELFFELYHQTKEAGRKVPEKTLFDGKSSLRAADLMIKKAGSILNHDQLERERI
jgi:UDP-2,4-diacetamido-2,4,6-trideoxy-beta-L-altropyranose hydrolase